MNHSPLSSSSQLETVKSRSTSCSSFSRFEIASSLDTTASPASPKWIRPRRRMIFRASFDHSLDPPFLDKCPDG